MRQSQAGKHDRRRPKPLPKFRRRPWMVKRLKAAGLYQTALAKPRFTWWDWERIMAAKG